MNPIRIDFCDIASTPAKNDHFFYQLLRRYFPVMLCDRPDYLFYSDAGRHHQLYTCPRIYFTIEAHAPNFNECDYAFTGNYIEDPRHLRLPVYVHYCQGGAAALIKKPDECSQVLATKNKFCCLVTSNARSPSTRTRTEFFHRLRQYKKVDSGGGALNNLGCQVPWGGKLEFLKPYKFNIAFENESRPGYTSEKIYEAMQARCLPIYWGNPLIGREFNPRSFLNYGDYPSAEALVDKIIELDRDEAKYAAFLQEPFLHHNEPGEFFDEQRLVGQFERIFSTPIRPVGQRRRFFPVGRWLLMKKDKPTAQNLLPAKPKPG